jgi:23S rRNA pseudouridine1911/1915/1917 synthase
VVASVGKPVLIVPAGAAGSRLDAWLAAETGRSRSAAAALAEAGEVTVDEVPRGKSHRLAGGERVEIAEKPEPPVPPAPTARIAWDNGDLLIVDKPPGLVVHPAPGHRGITLVEQLAAGGRPALAVHRLDRDTSGLMIVSRSEAVRDELQRLIRRRAVDRRYLALADGRVESLTGTIDAPLGRDSKQRARMSVRAAGREARTHFEVLELLGDATYLRVALETGRTHQIRAHFAAIGHPLAGDGPYGGAKRFGLQRQFLHSTRLRFTYSGAPGPIEVEAPLPPDLATALEAARG